jgi:O-antigen ligase
MSTTSTVFETTSSSDRTALRSPVCLTLLSLALGYAVFQDGGLLLTHWNICLLLLGLATFIYWTRRLPSGAASSTSSQSLVLLLLLGYIAFQLLPQPVVLLRVLSPERARILDSLTRVTSPVRFAPLAITPATTFVHLFRIIGYTLAFLMVRDATRRWSARRNWLAVIPLVGFAVLEAALGFWQNAAGEEVEGTYVNRNHFAGLLEMALPLALACGIALLHRRDSTRDSLVLPILKAGLVLISTGAIFAGLLCSLSKMGFAAGLGGLFAMAALAVASRLLGWKRALAIAGIAALVLFLFVFLPPDELVARFGGLASPGEPPVEGRWPIWRDTLHLIAGYPVFGSGLGTYEVAFLKYQTSIVDRVFDFAHNDYLQLTAELGAAGLLFLATLVLPVVTNSFRAATRSRDPDTRWLALGCTGAFTAIGLHSLVDFNTYVPANALMLAWIGGISAGLPARSAVPVPQRDRWFGEQRLALFLAALLAVYAPAWILFRAAFRGDVRAEGVFCRLGICDTDAVLTAQILGHAGNVAAVPEAELLKALRRDPNSPDRWCDAGDSFLTSGKWAQAEYCYSAAQALGPNIPPILMRISDSYYRLHQTERALDQRSHILRQTDTYDGLIFDWYWTKKLPVSVVLVHGLPDAARAGRAYLRHLLTLDESRDAAEVWNWNVGHGYADDRLANDYLGFLVKQQEYEAAAQAWAHYLGPRRHDYMESNWIFNGEFENEVSTSPFDWRIDKREDVEVSRDAGVAHGGTHSLRIGFEGNQNLNYSDVSQTIFLKPGRYRFDAYVRTERLTTDEGIGFHILDPAASSRLDVMTKRLTGSNDWKKIEQVFDIRPQTKLIQIRVVRQPSLKFDNDISGTVWIDTVKVTPINLSKPRPERSSHGAGGGSYRQPLSYLFEGLRLLG